MPQPKHHQNIITAGMMVICLCILLCTVYVQQQTYRYIQSSGAIRKSLLLDDAERVKSIPDIFDWYKSLTDQLGHNTYQDVKANCKLKYGNERITVDGKEYAQVDSDIYDPACENMEYIIDKGDRRTVHIAGNHEVLAFGFFMQRSFPAMSEKHAANERTSIISNTPKPSNAMRDPRMIETCSNRYGICVARDGFQNSSGTTLNWEGMEVGGQVRYRNDSEAYLHVAASSIDGSLRPCYPYYHDESTGTNSILPDHQIFNESLSRWKEPECKLTWVTTGGNARSACLLVESDEFTFEDSFSAAYAGAPSVTIMFDIFFMCSSLTQMSIEALKKVFVESSYTIRVYLPKEEMYGNFYDVNSEYHWVGESLTITKLLEAQSLIDENTRIYKNYIVSRNLGETELFYTLVDLEFVLHPSGMISTSYTIIYIPIVQYYYGMDSYPWRNRIVYVCEVLMTVVYALLLLKVAMRCIFIAKSLKSKTINIPQVKAINLSPTHKEDSSNQVSTNDVALDDTGDDSKPNSVAISQSSEYSVANSSDSPARGTDDSNPPKRSVRSDKSSGGNGDDDSDMDYDDDEFMSCYSGDSDSDGSSGVQMTETNQSSSRRLKMMGSNGRARSSRQLSRKRSVNGGLSSAYSTNSNSSYHRVSFRLPFVSPPAPHKVKIYSVRGVNFAFVLDVLAIGALTIAMVLRYNFVIHCRNTHNFILRDAGNYESRLEQIIEHFSDLRDQAQTIKLVITVCVLLAVMQIFSHLSYSRRLGIITGTIGRSLQDLLPVIVIFITILVAYAILGNSIYGDRIAEWSTIYSSMTRLFIMILGEYGIYEEMRDVSPVETVVFFWSYVCIVFFIVFNIALAVILELYSELRQDNIQHYHMKKMVSQKPRSEGSREGSSRKFD